MSADHHDFFNGWRRKLGCVTLLVAGLFMIGWLRSHLMADVVRPIQAQTSLVFASSSNRLFVGLVWEMAPSEFWEIDATNSVMDDLENDAAFQWIARLFGFGVGSAVEVPPVIFLIVPYWAVVVPLTALSGWLLLQRPRNCRVPDRKKLSDNRLVS